MTKSNNDDTGNVTKAVSTGNASNGAAGNNSSGRASGTSSPSDANAAGGKKNASAPTSRSATPPAGPAAAAGSADKPSTAPTSPVGDAPAGSNRGSRAGSRANRSGDAELLIPEGSGSGNAAASTSAENNSGANAGGANRELTFEELHNYATVKSLLMLLGAAANVASAGVLAGWHGGARGGTRWEKAGIPAAVAALVALGIMVVLVPMRVRTVGRRRLAYLLNSLFAVGSFGVVALGVILAAVEEPGLLMNGADKE